MAVAGINRPTMDGTNFKKFTDFIYDKTGIRFEESKNYFLASKVLRRTEALGLDSYEAYYRYITSDVNRRREVEKFIDIITIHETFFFRNQPQLESFERDILKPLVERKKGGRVRIWSAACSTGDEVYTTIFQFIQNGWHKQVRLEIVGSDISHQSVEDAKTGIYSEYALRNVPPDLRAKYFTEQEGRRAALSDDIKKMATFRPVNLKEPSETRALGKFDIVMCRNVLIYFDTAAKERVLWNIYDALDDESLLLVGHSENLYGFKHIFQAEKDLSDSFAYRKAPPGTEKLHV